MRSSRRDRPIAHTPESDAHSTTARVNRGEGVTVSTGLTLSERVYAHSFPTSPAACEAAVGRGDTFGAFRGVGWDPSVYPHVRHIGTDVVGRNQSAIPNATTANRLCLERCSHRTRTGFPLGNEERPARHVAWARGKHREQHE